MGRPEGALKYICLSPLRLLNRRSGTQPLSASQAATFLRSLDRHAKSMSWPARSRGGAAAAPRASMRASGSGSSGETAAVPDPPGSVIGACPRSMITEYFRSYLTVIFRDHGTGQAGPQLTQRRPVAILGACPGARLRLAQPINRPSAYSPCRQVSRTGALNSA